MRTVKIRDGITEGKKKEKGKTCSYFEQVKSVILEKEIISIRMETRK